MPAGELRCPGFFVSATLFLGAALFEFGEGVLGAADAVGGFPGGGYTGPVVLFAGGPLASGLVADVGHLGLGSVGRRLGLNSPELGIALFYDFREVALIGDLTVLVVGGEAGGLVAKELLGSDGASRLVSVNTAGRELATCAQGSGPGLRRVCVPEGTDLVRLLELSSLSVE
jgi:hypothetical protein